MKTIKGKIERCLLSNGFWNIELINGYKNIGMCQDILKEGDTIEITEGRAGKYFPINNTIKRIKKGV